MATAQSHGGYVAPADRYGVVPDSDFGGMGVTEAMPGVPDVPEAEGVPEAPEVQPPEGPPAAKRQRGGQ